MSYRTSAAPLARLAPRTTLWRKLGAIVGRGLLQRMERHHWRTLPAAVVLAQRGWLQQAMVRLYRKPRCCGLPMREVATTTRLVCRQCAWHTAPDLRTAWEMEAVRDVLRRAGLSRAGEPHMDDVYETAYVRSDAAFSAVSAWSVEGSWYPSRFLDALALIVEQEGRARYALPAPSVGAWGLAEHLRARGLTVDQD